MNTDQILKVLKNERECIKRRCDLNLKRNCMECDLYSLDDEMLEVYDFLINGYELLQNQGADSYTIRCKETLTKEQIDQFKKEWGQAVDTMSFKPIALPDNMKIIIQGDTD